MAWRAFVRLPRRSALARCRPAARPGDEGDPLRLLATGAVSFLGVGGWVFSREREPAHAQASIHSVPEALGRPPRPASVFEADGSGFSLLSPEYRRNVFFVYEKRLREHSPPEKVFEYFSSVKSADGTFMTSLDLMRAAVPVFQPADSKHIRSGSLGGEKKNDEDEHASGVSSNFFDMFDTDGDGLISFPEYLFFVTLLSLTDEQCKATFRKFDVDEGGSLCREEFLQRMKHMRLSTTKRRASGYRTGLKTVNDVDDLSGGLVHHLFGDGRRERKLSLKAFEAFLTKLRTEIDSLEFEHYDFKRQGSISAEDFGYSVVAGASVRQLQHFIDRAAKLSSSEVGRSGRRITKAQYMAFCQLLKHGNSRFENKIKERVGKGGRLTRDVFLKLAKECGARLSETMIDVVFFVFDVDGDGELSPVEFLDVVSRFQ